MRRAVIYVRDGDLAFYYTRCQQHCERQGYQEVGVVQSFEAGADMLKHDVADVLVYAREEDLPPDRVPRIERAFARNDPPGAARQRRPRQL